VENDDLCIGMFFQRPIESERTPPRVVERYEDTSMVLLTAQVGNKLGVTVITDAVIAVENSMCETTNRLLSPVDRDV
jgi:hypothetical protein